MTPPHPALAAGRQPYVWMLCGCAWFAAMALLTHEAGRVYDWPTVALARSALVTLFAAVLAVRQRVRFVVLRPGMLWLRSLAGSLSMVFTFYALTHLPPSEVLTLTNTFPIWVALLSWPLAGERPSGGVWVAVICSVAGVAIAQQPHADGVGPAAVAAVFASLFTAVAMLGLNRLKGVDSLAVVVHFSAVATLFAAVTAVVVACAHGPTRPPSAPHPPVDLALLFGVGATATAGQVFLTLAYTAGSATRVSVVGLSQVVMVMAAEAALGLRAVTPAAVVGTALVLGPTGWLMARGKR